jgi:mannosyltransferase
LIFTDARAESDAKASGYPMTVAGDVAERAGATPSDPSRDAAQPAGPRFGAVSDWAMRVPWLWPALLTAILGWYQLGRPELWRDELASWTFATRPVGDLITTAQHSDANHMVYYLLLHYWIAAFGDSVVAMRSLSVLAMAGAAACVTLAGRRLAGTRAGLLAGLVFALVPSVSRFAQEMRSYAFEVLVATLATLMLLRALERPAVRRWAAYGACLAALGYLDPVALAAVTGHAAVVAMRWWRDRDNRLFWFMPAALAGLAAWVPLALISWHEESGQVGWIPRPGLNLAVFSFFFRNLFYSTSVATALILLAILAWTVDRRSAAFATALAVVPVAAVWLVSQGPHAFFFARYLLPTVGAWAILAGIGLARVDGRAAAAVVLTLALLGAGDQQVIRSPGAHNWAYYPVGSGFTYPDFVGAAATIAREARAGDGIVYPDGGQGWQMINLGVQYYLEHDLGHGAVPHQLFLAGAAAQLQHLYPVFCTDPAACLGHAPRTWVVVSGDTSNPYGEMTSAQAAVLRSNYRLSHRQLVSGLTVFLLLKV